MEKKNKNTENKIDVQEIIDYGFNPLRDIQKVQQGLGVNIDDMLQTGVVRDTGEELENNGIEDPNLIVGRIADIFDAIDASRIIKKYGKKDPAKVQSELNNLTDTKNEQ